LVFLRDDRGFMFLSFITTLEEFDFTALSPSSFLFSCDEFGSKIYTIAGKEYEHFLHITYNFKVTAHFRVTEKMLYP
jgi:hypothetical protein